MSVYISACIQEGGGVLHGSIFGLLMVNPSLENQRQTNKQIAKWKIAKVTEELPRGGVAGSGSFTPTPPPPPTLGIGTEVPGHRRQRRPKANLLEPLEDPTMAFHPMCLYSKYSIFSREGAR